MGSEEHVRKLEQCQQTCERSLRSGGVQKPTHWSGQISTWLESIDGYLPPFLLFFRTVLPSLSHTCVVLIMSTLTNMIARASVSRGWHAPLLSLAFYVSPPLFFFFFFFLLPIIIESLKAQTLTIVFTWKYLSLYHRILLVW